MCKSTHVSINPKKSICKIASYQKKNNIDRVLITALLRLRSGFSTRSICSNYHLSSHQYFCCKKNITEPFLIFSGVFQRVAQFSTLPHHFNFTVTFVFSALVYLASLCFSASGENLQYKYRKS